MAQSHQAPPISSPPEPGRQAAPDGVGRRPDRAGITRLAVLDIGSNTVHVTVVDGRPDGTFTPVAEERDVSVLAKTSRAGMELPEEAIERLTSSVATMSRFATEHRAAALVAFATSAIREASNGMQALGRVREVTGVPVRVLPGVEEARLTYVAARAWAAAGHRRLLVLDIGGGSFEIAGGDDERPDLVTSLPLGVTRLTRRFLRDDPPAESGLVALREHSLNLLGEVADRVRERPWDLVCATSRTFRTLGRVAEELPATESPSERFGFAGIDGRTAAVLTAETVNVLAGRLARSTRRQRSRMRGLDRLRAENVVAGSQLAALAMQAFGLSHLVLAPWALREGIIIEQLRRQEGAVPAAEEAPDSLRHAAVLDFCRRYSWDEPHSRLVSDIAVSLFDQTRELHGLGDEERELLYFSGLLHDVGAAVAQSAHHKHSLYIIGNGDLAGFTERERRLMANIARYHRKALPAGHHGEYMALSDEDRRLVRRLGSLLRLADALDLDHYQLVERASLVPTDDGFDLELEARDEPESALRSAHELSDLFALEFDTEVTPVARRVD
ncbi:MAG: Ppx/GppA family phosphatase [Candidatus Dormibacteraeota bacterium]|nr:Ppx/GppA family phosphatase [Candidatus Dormibacteraeota bacterium]MBO0744438.1 Ppx/GppA family phosphatase [Candidatus Dormibacteraeota bacterium]